MKIVLTLNTVTAPADGYLISLQTNPLAKRNRIVALQTHDGVPAEILYAAACKTSGCVCAKTAGRN